MAGGRRKGLEVHSEIAWASGMAEEIDGTFYYANVACLVVYNDHPDGRTMENVRVRAGTFEMRECVDNLTGHRMVDLQSGEHALFELGHVIAPRMLGIPDQAISMSESDVLEARHNVANGTRILRVTDSQAIVLSWPEVPQETLQIAPVTMLSIVVGANDHPALRVRLVVDHRNLVSLDGGAGNPFLAEVIG